MAKPKPAAKPAPRKASRATPKKDANGRFVKGGAKSAAKSAAKPGDKRAERAPRREMSPAEIVNRDHQTRENTERAGHEAARAAARQPRTPR